MFQVLIGKKAKKLFEDLDKKTKDKFLIAFNVLEVNPWPAKEFDFSKIEGLQDCFRIRVGKYRICYYVNTDIREVTIYRIERKSETTYK
ncbi:type II toxin-antitoxin system RelE/ParE family toxin [Candidatus Micrarchaeota archaeon]|nr:type II toxin-antitoxin system RelE/ParE family toxin [Candidatus Micrarchaeota archaeon]